MDSNLEIMRLKVKCNKQLDEILILEKIIEDKNREVEKLKENNYVNCKKSNQKINGKKSDDTLIKNPLERYAKSIIYIIDWLQDGKLFINYKNACKNSKEFYRIKSEDFQAVAEKFIKESEINMFYKFCIGIGIVKSSSGTCIFNDVIQGKAMKVIFIRKAAFEVIENDT